MWTYQGKEVDGGQSYGGKMRVGEIIMGRGGAGRRNKIISYTGNPR